MSALPAPTPESVPFQPIDFATWEATPEAARIEDPLAKIQAFDDRTRKDLFKAGLYDAEAEDEIFNAGADQALQAGHITDKSQYAPTAKPKDPNFLARQLVRKGDTEKASAIFRYQSFLSRPDTDPVTLERARQEAELDPDTENELTRAAVRSGEIPFAVVHDKDGNAIFELDPELGALDREQLLDLAESVPGGFDPRFLPALEKQFTRVEGTNYTAAQFRQAGVFDGFLKEQKRTDEFLHGELEKAQDEYNKTGQLSTETQESLDRTLAALDVDGEFAPTTRGRLIRDTIKRASKPEGYDPNEPQNSVQYLEDGSVWLPEQVIFDQAKHDQVLDSLSVTPEQKEAAKKLRAGRLESIAPAMVDAMGANPDALDFFEKSKAAGKSDAEIATEWYSKPENYSGFANRARSFGMSLIEAGPGLFQSIGALAGNESAMESLKARAQDTARNEEYARLFGDSYGVGQSLLNTSSQVAVDLLAGLAVSAVATPVAGAAVIGSRAAGASLLRGLARTAVTEGARSSAAGFIRSAAGSAARTLATLGDDLVSKMAREAGGEAAERAAVRGATRAIAGQTGVAASSFTRSAGSAYVQAYSALDAQTNAQGQPLYSDEEKRKIALGTAMTAGTATAAITLGFGRMLGQGAEGLITGGLSTGVLRRVVGMTDDQIVSATRTSAMAILKAAGAEAPEEATDQLVGNVIQALGTGEEFRLGPALKEALEAGLVGGLLGGGIGAVQVGINKYRSPKVVALENANAPASAAALEAATKAQAEAPADPAANLKEASQDLDLRVTELKAQVQELSGDPKKNAGKLARAKKRLAEATAEKTRVDYAIKNPGAMQMGVAPEGIAAAEARGVATPAAGAPQAAAPQTVAEGAPAQPVVPTPAAPVVLNRRASALSKVLTNKGVSDGPATRFAAAFARNLSPDTTLEDARGQILEAFRSAGGIFADETADTAAVRANPQTWVDAGYTPEESQKFAELAAAEIEAAQEAADAANEAIVIPEPAAAEASTPEPAQTDATPAAAATPGVTITEPTQSFTDSPFFGGEISTPDGTKGHYSVKVLDDGTAVLSDIQIGYEGDAGRGKGFGTQAYEAIGRKLAERGITLQSTRWDKHQTAVSPQALRVWEKLEAAGLARKTGESETKVYDRQAGRETIAVAPEYEFVVPEAAAPAIPEDIIGTDQAPEPPDVEVVPEFGDQEPAPSAEESSVAAPKPQTTKATKFSQKARALVERMLTPESRTQPPEYLQQQKAFTPTQTQIQSRIAALYEAMPVDDSANPEVVQAYQNLVTEVVAQYRAMLGTGIRIEMGSENPYATSGDMIDDVERGRLWIYKTEPSSYGSDAMLNAGNHPMLAPTEFADLNGEPMLANDVFRAVHDYVAHAAFGFSFGPLGEEAAWKAHLSTLRDPLARLALTTETRGQNSWVNYRPEMLRDGMPIKKGEPGYVAPQDRPFATQKFALLPEEAMTLVPIVAPKRGKTPKTKKPTEKQIAAEMRAGTPLAVHETLFNDTISQGWVPTRNVLLNRLAEAGFGGQVYGKAFAETTETKIRELYPVTDVSKQKGVIFPTLDSLGFGDIKGPDNKTVKIPVFADDNTSGPFTNDPQTTAWQKNAGLSIKVPAGVAVNPAIKVNSRTGFVDYSTHNSGTRIYAKGDFKRAGNTIGSYLAFQNKQGFGASLETLPPFDSSKLAGPVDFAGMRIIPGETTEDDILRFYFAPSSDGGPSKIESAINASASGMSAVDKDQIRAAAQLSFIRELREFTLDMNDVGSVDPKGFLRTPDGYKAGIENRIANVWSKADRGKDGVINTSGHWNERGRPSHLAFFVKDAIRNHEKANERRPDANVQLGSDDVDQATALERAAARNQADGPDEIIAALDEAFDPDTLRGIGRLAGREGDTVPTIASSVTDLIAKIEANPKLRSAINTALVSTHVSPLGSPARVRFAALVKGLPASEVLVLAGQTAFTRPQLANISGLFKSLSYGLNTFTDAEIAQHREDNRAAVADLQLDGDLRSAIERIARSAKYPRRYRAIMLAALKMQVLPNISIVDAPAEAYAGSYTHSARLITLNLASSNGRGMLDVLAHELLHAATLEAIANPQTKAAKELLARLERARQKAAEVVPSDMSYAVSSIDEFITHAATDPRLQVILRETFEKGKTTWQRVVDAIAKFFGIANPDFVSDLWGFINHAAEYGLRPGVAASREQRSMPGTDWARRDAEYLAAVEAGDLETAQRMVDAAARDAGYDVGPVYHGTNDERTGGAVTVFSTEGVNTLGNRRKGAYFTPSRSYAEIYTRRDRKTSRADLEEARAMPRGPERDAAIDAAKYGGARTYAVYLKGRVVEFGFDNAAAVARNPEQWVRPGEVGRYPNPDNARDIWEATPEGARAYELVVLDPSQIKSADPVTRDDAGNVIPLSARFRPSSPDIRYSPAAQTPDTGVDQHLPELPAGLAYAFDDTRPKYLAYARRSQPGTVTVNRQALAAAVEGLDPANARAIVSKVVKHEIAHLAAFSAFTDADISEMARGMASHEMNDVARRYYGTPDALERLAADLESGAVTNEAIVEEYLRMQLELASDGSTTEATIAFHSDNPGFVSRLVKYLRDALVALWRNVAGPQEDYVNRVAISRLAREYRAILRGHKPLRAEPFDPADPNRDDNYVGALAPQQPTDPDADAAIREIFTESLEDFTKPYEPGSLWRRLFVVRTGDRRFPAISDKRQSSLVANERLVFARRKQLEKTIKEEQPDAQVLAAAAGDSSPTTTPEQDAYIAEEFAAALEEARGIEDPAEQASAVAEAYALKQRLTTTAYAETARIKKRRIDEAFEELERTAPKTAANLKAMREGIDNISRVVKEYQPEASPLRMVFDAQDGIYLTRVYRIHHKDGDPLAIFSDPAMADVREAAQDQLMASLIDIRVAEIIEQEAEAGKIIGDTEAREIALAEAEEQDLGRILLEDYLLAHGSKALPHNGTDFRIDLTRYFKKMPVPEALRNVLEEVTDPVELLTRTSLNVGMLAASTVFTRDLARGGYTSGAMVTGTQQRMYRKLIQEPDNDKYLAMLVDGGWAKRVTAPGYVEIAPDVHIPGWLVKAKEERDLTYLENFRQVSTTTKKFGAGKLADLYAHPVVADWMDHQFTRPKSVSMDDAKFVQKMGEVFAKATGMSLGVATLGSVGFYTRNFVGNAFFLAANGINPFSGKTKRASDLAMKAFLNRESGEVTKLTGLGVLNDDLRPETIKELLKGETDRPGGLNILELMGKVLGGKKGIEYGTKTTAGLAKLADAATAIDGIAKATTYYTELETLREAYPDKPAKWHEDEAAKIVKLTNQAKSQTPPIVDSLTSSSYGRLMAPFLRFKGEIFRLTGNIIARSAEEIKSDNPVIRARGYKRAAGFAMISAFSVAGPALISAMYGVGEDEEYALREALPPYLRGNSLIYLPSEDGKSVTSIDLSYLQPYSFIGDPISRVGRAVMRGEPGEGVDELAIWLNSNFLSEQILAGAAMEVLRNRTSDDKPITFETDDAAEKLLKYSKHLVGSSFTPQSLKSLQRSYDAARRGTPDDAPFFETPAGVLIGHGMPVRPRAFETESLALRAARKQAETNRQVRALAGQLKRRVNYTEGDIEDIVADLQDSTASLNADIARMISGYEGLGLPKASIAKQLVEAGRSRQFARAIVFRGVAAGPTITPATKRDLFEAGEAAGGPGGGEKRTRAVSEAMRQYPKTQQVRVVPQD